MPICVSAPRSSSSWPSVNVAAAKVCQVTAAPTAGFQVPLGSAMSVAAGMSSVSPCLASAPARHMVAWGARVAISTRSMSASQPASVLWYRPRLTCSIRLW